MASITSAGLGSGLDVNSLVSQLVQAERAPASGRLATRETRVQSKLSAYGSLKSAVAEFQDALKKLKKAETFQARSATSSQDSLVKASASSTASPGSHVVSVEALAQTQKLASAGLASADAVVGTGKLTISAAGKQFDVDIGSGAQTLAGVRDAINAATGNPGIRATLVTATTGTHLVLTAAGSGTAQGMTIAVTTTGSDTGNLAQLAYDPNAGSNPMTVKAEAVDARIKLDGFTLTSADNSFEQGIDGVTLTVTKADPGTPVNIVVAEDKAASRQAIDQFVTSFNKLQGKLGELTAYNPTTKSAGQLQGDAVTMRLASALRNELNTALSGADADLDTLAELGISSAAKGGTLSVNSSKLDGILASRFDDIAQLFSGDNGLAARMNKMLDGYAGNQGVIQSRTESLQGEAKILGNQREALNLRMSQLEARYTEQFTALDSLMSGLSNTSAFLTRQLANL